MRHPITSLAQGQRLSPLILACLAATWLVWGSTYLAIRFALAGFYPFYMMGTRFIVAGLLLMGWMLWRGAPLPTRRQWLHALVIGALMLGGGMGNTARAEMTVGSGLVVAFVAVLPVLLVIMNLGFRIYPSRREILGVLIGLGGVLMLTQGAGFKASPGGLAAIIVATLCWSLGSVLSRRFPLAPGSTGFASEMLCGGVVLLLVSWLRGEPWGATAPALAWMSWAYLVTFGSLIAFSAYMVLLARASPSLAASYAYVNPIIAMLLGIALGGERISAWEWSAAGVVLCGVLMLLLGQQPARSADET